MHTLANSYHHTGRWSEALSLRETVVALFRKIQCIEAIHQVMNNLANSYGSAGRHAEAYQMREDELGTSARRR